MESTPNDEETKDEKPKSATRLPDDTVESGKWTDEGNGCSCEDGVVTCLSRCLCGNLLTVLIASGVLFGVTLGLTLRMVFDYTDYREIWYIEYPGRVLTSLHTILIVPLITTSVARSMSVMTRTGSKKIGVATLAYSLMSSFCAGASSIVIATSLKPGHTGQIVNYVPTGPISSYTYIDTVVEVISASIPDNLATVTFRVKQMSYTPKTIYEFDGKQDRYINVTVDKPMYRTVNGPNMFGLMFVSLVVGYLTSQMGQNGEPILNLIVAVNDLLLRAIRVFKWYTPVGLLFITAAGLLKPDGMQHLWEESVYYLGTLFASVVFHGASVLPTAYYLTTWKNPWTFFTGQIRALLTAWGSGSRWVTLPITMDCLVNKNNVNSTIVNLMAPCGATINRDGTASYIMVNAIYIAQMHGINLSFGDLFTLCFTTMLASNTEGYGSTNYLLVLSSVGLPPENLPVIVSVYWLAEKLIAVMNVWGDAIGAGILDHHFSDGLTDHLSLYYTYVQTGGVDVHIPTPPATSLSPGEELLVDGVGNVAVSNENKSVESAIN